MTDTLQRLITALREELTQYGEMLALLDQQQEHAIHRHADEMFLSITTTQNQAAVIQEARRAREACRRETARETGLPDSATFAELLPLLPEDFRPLLRSLVDENNSLLLRIQQRARQNHLLLSRSVELMQQFLGMLFPARETGVYDERGQRQAGLAAPPLYEAVG
jgi:flagellar biosynthesis/type III secretory pathway chaperone